MSGKSPAGAEARSGPFGEESSAELVLVDPAQGLYDRNTLAQFWGLTEAELPAERWLAAAGASAIMLPETARDVLARTGWVGLMEHILGEGQFGSARYHLSVAQRAYYQIRPLLPRRATAALRRGLRRRAQPAFRLGWPIEDRYVRFLYETLDRATADRPDQAAAARRSLWPEDRPFAFVLTHDVERANGQAFIRRLAELDARYGFRSAFNFVCEDYPVDLELAADLRQSGFEVGIHGLKHDGKLFSSPADFLHAAERLGHHAERLQGVGFRSPATHRNPAWMQHLPFEYDASFFDTDPYEVMPGGTMSIWPFFLGRLVELPYTLVQDHTLLHVLSERTPRLWVDKVDFIAHWRGMALLNAHPDYLRTPAALSVYEEFLQHMTSRQGQTEVSYWHALPREVARWWRGRVPAPLSQLAAGLHRRATRHPMTDTGPTG